MSKAQCCFMATEPSAEDGFIRCDKRAEFGIYHECGHLECDTESCEEHVGPLLGCSALVPRNDKAWRVVPIGEVAP